MKRGDDNFLIIALYGIRTRSTSIAALFANAVIWMKQFGDDPDSIWVRGTGYSGRYTGFKATCAKLVKTGFAGVQAFEMVASERKTTWPGRDYKLMAACSSDGSYAMIGGNTRVVGNKMDVFRDMLNCCVEELRPHYGIGYSRERKFGPFYYAIGLNQGNAGASFTYSKELRISRWGSIGIDQRVWDRGYIRDVYPWNLLNSHQLQFPVGEISLGEWIDKKPSRGHLTEINDELSLWEVEQSRLLSVNKELSTKSYAAGWQTY